MRDLTQVSGAVWVASSPTWLTTTTIVVAGDGGCLLVDPGLLPAELTGLAAELTARGWHIRAVFSTHPHWDHVLFCHAFPPVARWATATAARWARQHADELLAEAARDLPGHTWDIVGGTTPLPGAGSAVPWDGPAATVVDTAAHAPGHASLLLPGERVLVAGDLLSDIEVPLLDPGAADPVGDYRRVLRDLTAVVEGCDVVVPGHGRVTDGSGAARRIAADLRYLDDLEAGSAPADPRLVDPRVRADHESQARGLRRFSHGR
ncbi:MBL fold metallo-hydrolase [Georgenia sp. MJ173]|uniref:MBL fold metallo-hydrolase n=1 Tax=Georgenia sunbinii TaxID=3117728 RepID=UPI002F26AA64